MYQIEIEAIDQPRSHENIEVLINVKIKLSVEKLKLITNVSVV
jgi:hypothetical protein